MAGPLTATFVRRFRNGPLIDVDLAIPIDGVNVTVLFGPSGSGKTTVLRCVAGLDRPDRGIIRFGDETWFDDDRGAWVPARRRRVGFVPQESSLFPHLSVWRNAGFGLRRVPRAARGGRTREVLGALGLDGLEHRRPRELSGGQQQRLALARALAPAPRLLLLDEPLSALDVPARSDLRTELRRTLAGLEIPTIVVTHDRTEALALGDRMAVLVNGQVRQVGSVEHVFGRPADQEVARIVGVETVVPGIVTEAREGLLSVDIGGRRVAALDREGVRGHVLACIRAEDVMLARTPPVLQSARNALTGRVEAVERDGPLYRVTLDCGFHLAAYVTPQALEELTLAPGEEVTALVKAPAIHCIPREA